MGRPAMGLRSRRRHSPSGGDCPMANLNKVMLIGRVAGENVEFRAFSNGGRVAKFRFAVAFTRSKKNPTTGAWEGGETAFLDIEAFNSNLERGRQLADLIERTGVTKGTQLYIE